MRSPRLISGSRTRARFVCSHSDGSLPVTCLSFPASRGPALPPAPRPPVLLPRLNGRPRAFRAGAGQGAAVAGERRGLHTGRPTVRREEEAAPPCRFGGIFTEDKARSGPRFCQEPVAASARRRSTRSPAPGCGAGRAQRGSGPGRRCPPASGAGAGGGAPPVHARGARGGRTATAASAGVAARQRHASSRLNTEQGERAAWSQQARPPMPGRAPPRSTGRPVRRRVDTFIQDGQLVPVPWPSPTGLTPWPRSRRRPGSPRADVVGAVVSTRGFRDPGPSRLTSATRGVPNASQDVAASTMWG